MKTLKLEVGKTYISRRGEEVKIVGKCIIGEYQYKGNNGHWYDEDGIWSNFIPDNPNDLIEEVGSTRHTFAVPDGVKEVSVEQEGNRIVVEMVPEEAKTPKPGDVMVNTCGRVYVLKEVEGNSIHKYYACLGWDGRVFYNNIVFPGRPATPEEAQPLWDALKKAGKRWNPETMEVEEVPERERIMEYLKGCAIDTTWIYWLAEGYLKYMEGKNETNR